MSNKVAGAILITGVLISSSMLAPNVDGLRIAVSVCFGVGVGLLLYGMMEGG